MTCFINEVVVCHDVINDYRHCFISDKMVISSLLVSFVIE